MVNINKKKKKIVLRDSLNNLQQWRSFLTGSDTASELNSTQALQSLHQWDLMGHRSLNCENKAGVQLMSSRVRSSVSLSVSLCHRRNSALCVFLPFFNLSARSMTQCLFFGSLLDPAQFVHHWIDWHWWNSSSSQSSKSRLLLLNLVLAKIHPNSGSWWFSVVKQACILMAWCTNIPFMLLLNCWNII